MIAKKTKSQSKEKAIEKLQSTNHPRIQTAEGWKRGQLRKQQERKEQNKLTG